MNYIKELQKLIILIYEESLDIDYTRKVIQDFIKEEIIELAKETYNTEDVVNSMIKEYYTKEP